MLLLNNCCHSADVHVPVGMHMEEPINSDSLKFEKDTYSKFKALKLLGDVDYLDQSECGPVDFVTVDRGNQRQLKWQINMTTKIERTQLLLLLWPLRQLMCTVQVLQE